MSDYDDHDDNLSFEDLEDEEREITSSEDEDWGDSMDDMDSEAWDRKYRGDDEEELEDDPWALS